MILNFWLILYFYLRSTFWLIYWMNVLRVLWLKHVTMVFWSFHIEMGVIWYTDSLSFAKNLNYCYFCLEILAIICTWWATDCWIDLSTCPVCSWFSSCSKPLLCNQNNLSQEEHFAQSLHKIFNITSSSFCSSKPIVTFASNTDELSINVHLRLTIYVCFYIR